MEDKRIRKTRQNIQQALVRLLAKRPFEQITVTELCAEASTSRVTFYTHYSDKYEVAEEVFAGMTRLVTEEYRALQQKNNPQKAPVASYCNLLDCILNLYEAHSELFASATPEKSPYLYFSLYKYLIRQVSEYLEKERAGSKLRYPVSHVTAFLCNGLWSYINQCHADHCPPQKIRSSAKTLLKDLLQSGVFGPPAGGQQQA